MAHATPIDFHDPYRGWVEGLRDRSDLSDDRSDTFAQLKRRFARSGKGLFDHGRVSLRPWMPPVLDQGALQSCTANALAAALGFEHDGLKLSRLLLYYLSRTYEHQMHRDSGARLHNAIRALREFGAAPECDWPYEPSKFADRPRAEALARAEHHKISRYAPLETGAMFRECLASGYPFVIGLRLGAGFWSPASAATGMIATPGEDEETPHGHAVCVIGYARRRPHLSTHGRDAGPGEEARLYYEVRNSVGPEWGDAGHCWIAADYLENQRLAGDAWTIRV